MGRLPLLLCNGEEYALPCGLAPVSRPREASCPPDFLLMEGRALSPGTEGEEEADSTGGRQIDSPARIRSMGILRTYVHKSYTTSAMPSPKSPEVTAAPRSDGHMGGSEWKCRPGRHAALELP